LGFWTIFKCFYPKFTLGPILNLYFHFEWTICKIEGPSLLDDHFESSQTQIKIQEKFRDRWCISLLYVWAQAKDVAMYLWIQVAQYVLLLLGPNINIHIMNHKNVLKWNQRTHMVCLILLYENTHIRICGEHLFAMNNLVDNTFNQLLCIC
jgi:hypothetical protein